MTPEKQKPLETPSLLLPTQIAETILTHEGTAFCLGNADGYEIVPEVRLGSDLYRPVRAGNALLRQKIISFPESPLPYENSETLHGEITSFIRRYVTLSEEFESTLAAYLMLTWVYDAFAEVPYLRFQGDFGSGKTRALVVSGSLAHKSFNAGGASTISPIFHILDKYQGTLILDEADFRVSDEKAEMVKILNNGNMRGFPVLRSMQNAQKEFEPRAFCVFGPKIIAMRGSYDDLALESRFLTEEMHRVVRSEGVPIAVPESLEAEARVLRRKLLSYRLKERYAPKVLPVLPQLPDRQKQVIGSLLAIAPSERVREQIIAVASRGIAQLSIERSWSFEAEVLKALLATEEAGSVLSVSEITKTLRLQTGREFDNRLTPALVGRTLRNRLGLALYKSKGVVCVVPGQGAVLEKLKERFGH